MNTFVKVEDIEAINDVDRKKQIIDTCLDQIQHILEEYLCYHVEKLILNLEDNWISCQTLVDLKRDSNELIGYCYAVLYMIERKDGS